MRIIISDKSTVVHDMYECNIRLRLRNMMKKSKTISKQASKTAKRCIKKNSRSFSNLISQYHENWSKFKINRHLIRSEKSETRSENAQNERQSFNQIKNFKFFTWKLKRNVERAIKRLFRMKSKRITCNAIDQNNAFNFEIHHRWIFNRRNCINKKHLKKIIFKTRNQSKRACSRQSYQESWIDSSVIKFDDILHRCCTRFEDKSFDCIMCSISRLSYCI